MLDQLRSFYGTEFVADLAALYLDDSRRLVAELRAALEGSDRGELVRITHDLKSSSAQLGATAVSEAAAAIEGGARSDMPLEELHGLAEDFFRLDEQAVEEIRGLTSSGWRPASTPGPR